MCITVMSLPGSSLSCQGATMSSPDDAFRADGSTPPVSVNLPKSQKVYHSERIFPVFTNMLPEGANRRALCRARKVDENDFFGMLEMICGMDAIGKFVLKRPEE